MEWVIVSVLGILLLVCVFLLVKEHYKVDKHTREMLDAQENALREEYDNEKERSLRMQRNKLIGTFFEKFGLILPGFTYNPYDIYLLSGAPVDFIVFDGLHDSNGKKCNSVDFLEFKSGSMGLSKPERAVKECICAGNVSYKKVGMTYKEDGENGNTVTITDTKTSRTYDKGSDNNLLPDIPSLTSADGKKWDEDDEPSAYAPLWEKIKLNFYTSRFNGWLSKYTTKKYVRPSKRKK